MGLGAEPLTTTPPQRIAMIQMSTGCMLIDLQVFVAFVANKDLLVLASRGRTIILVARACRKCKHKYNHGKGLRDSSRDV